MGKEWDGWASPAAFQRWCKAWAEEALRVLKPGGHMLAFGGTRTVHRLTSGIEDAGFEIRDRGRNLRTGKVMPAELAWVQGSGFPKSLNVGRAVMKYQGLDPDEDDWTPEAEQWRGHGTALKPAYEPIVVARKPLSEGTVAANVLRWGTGGINVDGTRVRLEGEKPPTGSGRSVQRSSMEGGAMLGLGAPIATSTQGRWPSHLVLTHDARDTDRCHESCPAAVMDGQSGESGTNGPVRVGGVQRKPARKWAGGEMPMTHEAVEDFGDSGGASRFFPQFRWHPDDDPAPFLYTAKAASAERPRSEQIAHPTVKPLELMRWLVRLITPPDGTCLDMFAGSGTTGEAALQEGMRAVLIEREPDYLPLIVQRLTRQRDPVAHAHATRNTDSDQPDLFTELVHEDVDRQVAGYSPAVREAAHQLADQIIADKE